MENKTSRRIKLLIAGVLVLFLVMAVVDFVPGFVAGFRAGMEKGHDEAHAMLFGSDSLSVQHLFATVEPIDQEAGRQQLADRIEFSTMQAHGELAVSGPAGKGWVWSRVAFSLLGLAGGAAMLVFLVSLIIFAVGFPRRRILSRENIVSLRWIAASLGAFGLVAYGLMSVDYLWLRGHVVLEGYRIVLSSPPSALIVALILVALTEILNMAGKLQNEQDLTI